MSPPRRTANARLCDFYSLPEPKSGGFERVSVKPEDHRGGLLTMGSVLGLTSDDTRHRPVHRGVWVSETIFNKTPPSLYADFKKGTQGQNRKIWAKNDIE